MIDAELLNAISDLLDQKLEEMLEKKLEEMLEKKLEEMLEKKLEEKLAPIRRDIEELKADNKRIHARLDALEREVRRTSLILENEVLPRLQTIEQCYVDSSRLFMKKSEQIDTMQDDIDVMKVVVQDHSRKLGMAY